jgi:hypothetical protein
MIRARSRELSLRYQWLSASPSFNPEHMQIASWRHEPQATTARLGKPWICFAIQHEYSMRAAGTASVRRQLACAAALQNPKPHPTNTKKVPSRVIQWVSMDCCTCTQTTLHPRYSKSITPNLMPSLCVDSKCRPTPWKGYLDANQCASPKPSNAAKVIENMKAQKSCPLISRGWSVPNVMVEAGQSG